MVVDEAKDGVRELRSIVYDAEQVGFLPCLLESLCVRVYVHLDRH